MELVVIDKSNLTKKVAKSYAENIEKINFCCKDYQVNYSSYFTLVLEIYHYSTIERDCNIAFDYLYFNVYCILLNERNHKKTIPMVKHHILNYLKAMNYEEFAFNTLAGMFYAFVCIDTNTEEDLLVMLQGINQNKVQYLFD